MIVMIASKGSTPCGKSCPYFEESEEVQCIGGPKKTHCKLIMQPCWLDCNEFDVRTLQYMEVNEEELEAMQVAAGQRARRVRKLWKNDHKETHPVGRRIIRKKK